MASSMIKHRGASGRAMALALKEVVEGKGWAFFDTPSRPFNLNIIGVRSRIREYDESGPRFDDTLYVAYHDPAGEWVVDEYEITTDPGVYLKRPIASVRKKGTAILAPGQYRGAYKIGAHFSYQALVQAGGPVTVFRDNDRDYTLDLDTPTEHGFFGINIHKRRGEDDFVRGASAGCQVFRYAADFSAFMGIVKRAAQEFSNSFTYTLLDEADLGEALA